MSSTRSVGASAAAAAAAVQGADTFTAVLVVVVAGAVVLVVEGALEVVLGATDVVVLVDELEQAATATAITTSEDTAATRDQLGETRSPAGLDGVANASLPDDPMGQGLPLAPLHGRLEWSLAAC
jgi:hypothetical protein